MNDPQTADITLLRELNERTLLALIREQGPISRAELSRRSNLSRSTVSSIVNELLLSNAVRETGTGSSQGGRRPIMLEFNYQSGYVLGVDLAAERLVVLLCDLQANVLARAERPIDGAAGPLACIEQLAQLCASAAREAGIAKSAIVGVGVGVPGPLSAATGRLVTPPALPGWHDEPLRTWLERALGARVFLENDANLGALAEHRWGTARGRRNMAYIYYGTSGIGGGLILDDRLFRGDAGSAGEFGHLSIDENGPPCRCGSTGCLEAFIGSTALVEKAQRHGLEVASVKGIIEQAHGGNDRAQAILATAAAQLGGGIASLLNLLNPGSVVIGGDLAEAGDLFLASLRATLHRRGLPVAANSIDIIPGVLGQDVIARGAVCIVLQHVFGAPSAQALQRTVEASVFKGVVATP